jgi:chain length determinant protein tyrosine kinase EpsG
MSVQDSSNNQDQSIGDIIAQAKNLNPEQIQQVLTYQREKGIKFGEAAVALGFANPDDVLWALSQQFHYPYAANGASASLSSELVVATSPFDASAEFFRDIRSHLISNALDGQAARTALAICSPHTGDGKTYFAANLASAFSQLGKRTLLVDADMRTPRLESLFGIETGSGGLSGILAGRAETNVIRPVAALPSLYVLPVGVVPPNPLELLQHTAFDLLLEELMRKFDYVIVDTPAAIHGADARVIAAKCGSAIVLGRRGQTGLAALQNLTTSLKKNTRRYVGAVINEH